MRVFDVAQFRLQVNVEAAKIPLLIQELERGRFITVTQVDVASVDSDVMAAAGYVYGTHARGGSDAVVRGAALPGVDGSADAAGGAAVLRVRPPPLAQPG